MPKARILRVAADSLSREEQLSLSRIKIKNFTAFESLDVGLSPGVNVFIGANGTGKTHLLKLAYCACKASRLGVSFPNKLIEVFLPYEKRLGRLTHSSKKRNEAKVEIYRGDSELNLVFWKQPKNPAIIARSSLKSWKTWTVEPIECAYIPVKEILANAPGFHSLFAAREVHFEEVYDDIIVRAFLPVLRGPQDANRRNLLSKLEKMVDGKVTAKNETFFLKNRQGELEFDLLAEGMRKLCLLWLLIRNGTLHKGSVLFWDEPETNLNPGVMGMLVEVLLELQRQGVQILLATHDYVVLKELDLRAAESDKVLFHALHRGEDGVIRHNSTEDLLQLQPNAITRAFLDLYDRDVKRDLE